jgi:hypothetical protein
LVCRTCSVLDNEISLILAKFVAVWSFVGRQISQCWATKRLLMETNCLVPRVVPVALTPPSTQCPALKNHLTKVRSEQAILMVCDRPRLLCVNHINSPEKRHVLPSTTAIVTKNNLSYFRSLQLPNRPNAQRLEPRRILSRFEEKTGPLEQTQGLTDFTLTIFRRDLLIFSWRLPLYCSVVTPDTFFWRQSRLCPCEINRHANPRTKLLALFPCLVRQQLHQKPSDDAPWLIHQEKVHCYAQLVLHSKRSTTQVAL